MAVRLCEIVMASTMAELLRRRDAAAQADLVELRLDGVSSPDVTAALADRPCPAIVTCRPTWEGGRYDGAEAGRVKLLLDALAAGADYVDVEWAAPDRDLLLQADPRRVVLSLHEVDRAIGDLRQQVQAMCATPAAVVKVAVRTPRLGDLVRLLELAASCPGRLVLVGLGEAGVVSRVLAGRFGSRWMYAADEPLVAGMLPASRLRDEFRVSSLGPATRLVGLLGRPVGHSVSPAMHNAALAALGLDAVYVPLEAESMDDFLVLDRAMSFEGLSVTAPFKRDALELAAARTPAAERVGSANTLRRVDGVWHAHNTDLEAFQSSLEAGGPVRQARAVVLGAGGAAAAVVEALVAAGAEPTVAARRPDAARALAERTGCAWVPFPPGAGTWDLLVNATPVGTFPHVAESPMAGLPLDGRCVFDLVYNPDPTRLVRDARAAGLDAIGGLDMLVRQACAQLEWWTGRAVPPDGLTRAARARLAAMRRDVPAESVP